MLADEIDISRGDIIVDANDTTANVSNHALVDIVWMSEQPLVQGQTLDIKVAGKKSCQNREYSLSVDVDKLTQQVTESLALNAIGHVEVLFLKSHWCWITINLMHKQGAYFIDRLSNVTVGAGLIREIRDNEQPTTSQYDAFEIELNQLIRRHFPHWGRDLLGGK